MGFLLLSLRLGPLLVFSREHGAVVGKTVARLMGLTQSDLGAPTNIVKGHQPSVEIADISGLHGFHEVV